VDDKRLVAALMESLAAGVTTVQEEEVCRGEREAGRRRERESRGGCLVVVVASYGQLVAEKPGGGSSWWLEQRRERGKEKLQKRGQRGWFLADFGPNILLLKAINSASIYRQWKRVISSLQGKNFQPLIQLGRIPTVGSK
jgi:hypothetical protein